MHSRRVAMWLVLSLAAACGCQTVPHTDLTFQRGVQLLAAGSPKTAIPLLTQVVASVPDGPEPHAMLALAYALDLQSERAIFEAAQARRSRQEPPGWERMAVGIAELSRGRQAESIHHFEHLVSRLPSESPMSLAARQWMTMALLLEGDYNRAIELLDELAAATPARTTALLWAVLVHCRQGQVPQAAETLTWVAKEIALPRPAPLKVGPDADDHALYEAAVLALAEGNLAAAEEFLVLIQQRSPKACDAPTWLALIAAARGDWTLARSRLRDACNTGALKSQGVAHQLHGVICAMEGMPENVVSSMVSGQRLLGRRSSPASCAR